MLEYGLSIKPTLFSKHSIGAYIHVRTLTITNMNTITQSYPYEHLRKTEPADPRD
jgi:hypothetical protein